MLSLFARKVYANSESEPDQIILLEVESEDRTRTLLRLSPEMAERLATRLQVAARSSIATQVFQRGL